MRNDNVLEGLELSVMGKPIEVLYCYWKAPPLNLYQTGGLHFHRYHEVHYALDETTRVMIPHSMLEIKPGQALIIPPRMPHHTTSDHSRGKSFTYSIEPPCARLECLQFQRGYQVVDGVTPLYMEQISSEINKKRPGYREKLKPLFTLVLTDLVQCMENAADIPAPAMSRSLRGMVIDRFVTLQIRNGARKSDLATEMNLSERQLERIVFDIFGTSYSDMVKMQKFQLAAMLLNDKEWKSKDVAALLGYSDEGNFSRAFKNYLGLRPKDMSFCDM